MALHFDIITLFPDMFNALEYGVIRRAKEQGLITVRCWNPRDFTHDTHHTVDDRPYGGGPGMVMKFEPLHAAITAAASAQSTSAQRLYLSPQGKTFDQSAASDLAKHQRLILVAGRYESIDERVINTDIDSEWSVGDFVVSGGELPAMIMIDAITRLLPGALGHALSAAHDSFSNDRLDHPHYTRPETVAGQSVPKVLLSGDHQAIERWRCKQALGKTWQMRPDLLKRRVLTDSEKKLLEEYISELRKQE